MWVAWMFISVGIVCATLAAIGLYADHYKLRRLLGLYNGCVVLVLCVCSAVSVLCWVLTGELDNHFRDMTPADIQDIPCRAGFEGCCCCGDDIEEVSLCVCLCVCVCLCLCLCANLLVVEVLSIVGLCLTRINEFALRIGCLKSHHFGRLYLFHLCSILLSIYLSIYLSTSMHVCMYVSIICCLLSGAVCPQICPEWSKSEIMDFISLILKFMGFVSFFVGFFMGFGFLGAIAWYKSLEEYQCEMV
jgi:hypothetical protein